MEVFYLRFPEGKPKAFTMSYDDGVEQDKRLIEIMKSYGLKGTFNLNSGLYAEEGTEYPIGTIHRRMSRSMVDSLYADSGMEVALHGYDHPWLEQLSPSACTQQIIKDKDTLEKQFGMIVRGMAYPYGTYSDLVVDILKACGVAYARTVESTGNFKIPKDWLRMPATCHHNDPRLMQLANDFISRSPSRCEGECFYLWGHSYEFEANNNWQLIQEFARLISRRSDIWYCTNIEYHDYVEAFRSLHTSCDGTLIYNPSAMSVWGATQNGQVLEIQPGKMIRL